MSADTQPAADAKPSRERAPRWFLALGIAGAAWFIWLMVQSGNDLSIRAKVGELIELAQKRPEEAAKHEYVARLAEDPNGGVRLALKGEPRLQGKLIALIPQVVDGRLIGWRCLSDAPRQFLPRHCTEQ